ncbi:hypothetical protein HDU97_009987 [Phlyctochytrium planicorne]|nr:hypothetical protein HDU97_009987 [Phlyctochytrium planicorne]
MFAFSGRLLSCILPSVPQSVYQNDEKKARSKFALVIHGGAGVIRRENMTPEKERLYRQGLKDALMAGHAVLAKGGSALDAVEEAVKALEDNPLFNAGAVMTESPHVFLAHPDATTLATAKGLEIVDPKFFYTDERWKQHVEGSQPALSECAPEAGGYVDPAPKGTVGAVAVDMDGNLAAATSTGGKTNKWNNRIGDTPLIGCGTYAEANVCAVSGTGDGEFFIRHCVAYDVAARIKYGKQKFGQAAEDAIKWMGSTGGSGGLIAVSALGEVSMPFNSEGMFRGYVKNDGEFVVAIYEDESQ